MPVLTNGNAFLDALHLLNLSVNFGRANTHTTRIKRCIRPSMYNQAMVLCFFNPVTMMPDIFITLKIGVFILGIVLIIPKSDGHRGDSICTDQLSSPCALLYGFAIIIKNINGCSQSWSL